MIINRGTKHKTDEPDNDSLFAKIKRKYPAYFWPQLLLEAIVKTANKREKQRLLNVVTQMQEKTALSKQLTKLLQY